VVRERAVPFSGSRRWLRGRILDRLRDADDETWTGFDGPIGDHDRIAVGEALRALAHEGLVELLPDRAALRARLPIA
jgi:hypothetical protein